VDTGYYVQLLDRVSSEKEKSFFCDHIASFSRKMRRFKKNNVKISRKNWRKNSAKKLMQKFCEKILNFSENVAKFIKKFCEIFAFREYFRFIYFRKTFRLLETLLLERRFSFVFLHTLYNIQSKVTWKCSTGNVYRCQVQFQKYNCHTGTF